MMKYDNLIMPDKARRAAMTLKQFCNQTGCVYCTFWNKAGEVCELQTVPREYKITARSYTEGDEIQHA